jgi:hypothetical protein
MIHLIEERPWILVLLIILAVVMGIAFWQVRDVAYLSKIFHISKTAKHFTMPDLNQLKEQISTITASLTVR